MPPSAPGAEWGAAVDRFLTFCSLERGLAPKTIEAYGRDLARFVEHLDECSVKRLSDVRRQHLTGYLEANKPKLRP